MLAINTNVSSLNARRHLVQSTNLLGRTFERLSSGQRINGARDDAAGLSISTRMTAQIRGLNMAIRNANDGISLMQIAEGALDETTNALQRMRELAIQSNNGVMTASDRNDLQKEVTQLMAEIERISTTTEFNNMKVIDGTFSQADFQVGADAGQTIRLAIGAAGTSALGLSIGGGAVQSLMSIGGGAALITYSGLNMVEHALVKIDAAIGSISDIRANLGAHQNRFESLMANLSNISENTSAARSRIMDADIAMETAMLTKTAIMQQAGTAILAQANQQPQLALQLLG